MAEDDNKYRIITKVSANWLSKRNYPVIIVPTIVLNENTSGYIWYDYQDLETGCNTSNTSRQYIAYNNTSARFALNRNYSIYKYRCTTWCGRHCWGCSYHCHYSGRYDS